MEGLLISTHRGNGYGISTSGGGHFFLGRREEVHTRHGWILAVAVSALGGAAATAAEAASAILKDREEIEALQLGAVQLLAPSTAKLVPWFPQYQVFDLPYLFADQEHAYRSMTDPRVTAKLFPLLKSRGMLGLAAWDNGFKHMTSNKCPIVKPEDMKGWWTARRTPSPTSIPNGWRSDTG